LSNIDERFIICHWKIQELIPRRFVGKDTAMLKKLRLRLRALFFRSGIEHELDEELRFHLEREIDENIARGMKPEEARNAALRSFGGVELFKDACRDERRVRFLEEVWQDLRYGARMLIINPSFTLIAVMTLALGIGSNTTVFSLADAAMLRPFNFPQQDRLVMIWEKPVPGFTKLFVAPGNFHDWLEQSQSFEHLVAMEQLSFDLTGIDYPERFNGNAVSTGFFDVLGVKAALGRTFQPGEDRAGRNQVIVLKHSLWQRRFGADPSIVGKTLTLNAKTFTVIGVMQPDFNFSINAGEVWSPIVFDDQTKRNRSRRILHVLGLLKPGVSIAQANAEIDAISRRAQQLYPETNTGKGHFVIDMTKDFVRPARMFVPVLIGMAGFVLMIACANVANLLFSRALTRQKEIAVRMALGASRFRLMRQMLTESMMLALASGSLGLCLSWGAVAQLRRSIPEDFAKLVPGLDHLGINRTALLFTLLVSVLTVMLFGLLSAFQMSKPNLNESLKEGAKSASSAVSRRRLSNALVVGEIAIALMLLIGAGLMLRSFGAMMRDEIGFNPKNVLGFQIELPEEKYTEEKGRIFFDQLLKRLQTLPGIEAVGSILRLPMSGEGYRTSFAIVGAPPVERGKEPYPNLRIVSPGYFNTIGMKLQRGRDFTPQDNERSAGVVIINQALAHRYFPIKEPLGQRITSGQNDRPLEIVGIVNDVKNKLDEIAEPCLYLVYAQYSLRNMGIVIRTTGEPTAIAGAARKEVMKLDPSRPINNPKTIEQLVYERTTPKRVMTAMMNLIAGIALLLAIVGIYAVIAYSVSQRTHEIGIRLALGAQPRNTLQLIIKYGLRLTLFGLVLGMLGAFVLARVLSPFLYGIRATDPLTFVLISLLLTGVALLACWIPARRAMKVDPIIALRCE
jgi:putative ABC transport system permease protein